SRSSASAAHRPARSGIPPPSLPPSTMTAWAALDSESYGAIQRAVSGEERRKTAAPVIVTDNHINAAAIGNTNNVRLHGTNHAAHASCCCGVRKASERGINPQP